MGCTHSTPDKPTIIQHTLPSKSQNVKCPPRLPSSYREHRRTNYNNSGYTNSNSNNNSSHSYTLDFNSMLVAAVFSDPSCHGGFGGGGCDSGGGGCDSGGGGCDSGGGGCDSGGGGCDSGGGD